MSSLLSFAEIIAQTTAPAAPAGGAPAGAPAGGLMSQLGPLPVMILLFGAMYFFMIAPQRKKQKEHEKMLKELQAGAEIVTSSGIYGTITNTKEHTFIVRISDSTKIEILKSHVATVINKGSDSAASTSDKK